MNEKIKAIIEMYNTNKNIKWNITLIGNDIIILTNTYDSREYHIIINEYLYILETTSHEVICSLNYKAVEEFTHQQYTLDEKLDYAIGNTITYFYISLE